MYEVLVGGVVGTRDRDVAAACRRRRVGQIFPRNVNKQNPTHSSRLQSMPLTLLNCCLLSAYQISTLSYSIFQKFCQKDHCKKRYLIAYFRWLLLRVNISFSAKTLCNGFDRVENSIVVLERISPKGHGASFVSIRRSPWVLWRPSFLFPDSNWRYIYKYDKQ